jgi:hypothetical protein
MPVYRCYFVADRRIAGVELIECDSDEEAWRRALGLLAERNRERPRFSGIELWDVDRMVDAYPPPAEPRAFRR